MCPTDEGTWGVLGKGRGCGTQGRPLLSQAPSAAVRLCRMPLGNILLQSYKNNIQ
jgi:hypothetical protein